MRVQILDGKTGRPIANQRLLLQGKDGHALGGDGPGKPGMTGFTTDGEGYAPVPNVDASVPEISISVEMHRACSKTERHEFSLLKVRTSGVVSENSCKPRISMYPQPGTLIFYVRDLTLLEKMRR